MCLRQVVVKISLKFYVTEIRSFKRIEKHQDFLMYSRIETRDNFINQHPLGSQFLKVLSQRIQKRRKEVYKAKLVDTYHLLVTLSKAWVKMVSRWGNDEKYT